MLVPSLALVVLTAVAGTGCEPSNVLSVGPGREFARPCQAIAAAAPGDVIEIDAAGNGTYDGDVCRWTTDRLTIVGVNGRAAIDADGRSSGGKGIWVIAGDHTTVRNVELSGAAVADRNGAGIRLEGTGLTVEDSFFHDNENGILTGADPASDVVVDRSEFARNGAGDGYSHNIYIGALRTFVLRRSYSHDADVGHLVKSRAATNYLLQNRLTQEEGTGSYEVDLPNGGRSYLIGNIIQQGPTSQNSTLVAYGLEGVTHPSNQLYAINNTLVNDRGSGTAVRIGTTVAASALVQNNLSTGSPTFVSQVSAVLVTNCITATPGFVDRAGHDHRLTATSPCLDVGSPAGAADGFPLQPTEQYAYDLGSTPRIVTGSGIDAGAFER
jgi:hypothetical protein